MSEPAPQHGPARRRVIRVMTAVFVALLVLMLLLGTAMVLLQLVGVVALSADLVSGASNALAPWAYGVGGALGIWTLLLSYANGWKPTEG
jgi:hypothetical protein